VKYARIKGFTVWDIRKDERDARDDDKVMLGSTKDAAEAIDIANRESKWNPVIEMALVLKNGEPDVLTFVPKTYEPNEYGERQNPWHSVTSMEAKILNQPTETVVRPAGTPPKRSAFDRLPDPEPVQAAPARAEEAPTEVLDRPAFNPAAGADDGPDYAGMTWAELQKAAKALGVKASRRPRAEIIADCQAVGA
jgi:hypothetical protein